MNQVIAVCLLIVGVIHLLPILGMTGVNQLERLYGIQVIEPNLEILMRHRAVLFGLLGGFFVTAAFKPQFQKAAVIMGLVSVLSFIVMAWSVGGVNAALIKVVYVDWIALTVLIIASILMFKNSSNPSR